MADGSIIMTPVFFPDALPAGTAARGYYFRVDSGDRVRDTLIAIDLHSRIVGAGADTMTVQEIDGDPLIAFDPEGRFLVTVSIDSSSSAGYRTYSVTRRDLEASSTRTWAFKRVAVPIPVQEQRRAAVQDSIVLRTRYSDEGIPVELIESELRAPAFREPVSDVLVAQDGTVWLKNDDAAGGPTWSLVNGSGHICAILRSPESVKLIQVDDTSAWGFEWRADAQSGEIERFKIKTSDSSSGMLDACK